jgi:hypothetical protein
MHPRAKNCVPANNNVYTDTDGYQLPNFATFFCTGLMVPFIILLLRVNHALSFVSCWLCTDLILALHLSLGKDQASEGDA